MSTKFVAALAAIILITLVVVPATAEGTFCIAALVVSYETTPYGDLEVEVVDTNGDIWAYYADNAHIGDVVILKVFDFGDGDPGEIVDVIHIGRLNTVEMIQWFRCL